MLSPRSSTELQEILSEVRKATSSSFLSHVMFKDGYVVVDKRELRFGASGMQYGQGAFYSVRRDVIEKAIKDGTLKELLETEEAISTITGGGCGGT